MGMLWTDTYFPTGFEEFVGNSEIVDFALKWASGWERGKKARPLLFFGPTGTGKTCLAVLLARRFAWDFFELNASDFRSREIIDRVAGAACQGASFSGKKRLILLDEIDGLQAQDRGGAAAIARILRESNNPVVLTANDVYGDAKLIPLRAQCELLQFKKINYMSIAKRLREILEKEKIRHDPEAVRLLAKKCSGDFRSALLDLQTISLGGSVSARDVEQLGYRERQENIFRVLEAIFKGKNLAEVRKARFQSDVGYDLLMRWVEENIPRAYTYPDDVASAFAMLSRADIFEGRIFNRQHYGFKRYSSELFSAGVALSKRHEYHGWLKLQFPQLLKKLSASSAARTLRKELAGKFGQKMHSSSRRVIAEDLPFIKMLFQDKAKAAMLSAEFSLDEKEIAFLLESKPDSKKVREIFDEARSLKQRELAARRKPLAAVDENSLKRFEEPPAEETQPEQEEEQNQAKLF